MSCGRQSLNRGFSLIEVVASVMLVGTLLVAMLKAHRDSARQLVTANRRQAAIEQLDELLSTPDQFVLQEPTGKVPGDNRLHWRTTPRADAQAKAVGGMIVRVEIFEPDFRAGETLAWVELLAPGSGAFREEDNGERP